MSLRGRGEGGRFWFPMLATSRLVASRGRRVGHLRGANRVNFQLRNASPRWDGVGHDARQTSRARRGKSRLRGRQDVPSSTSKEGRVAVLVAAGSPTALPAKAATTVIPTVFMVGSDPVELGLVASLNRPGGNLTGVSYLNAEVAPKRLELLHEFIPAAKSIALLVNPADPVAAEKQAKELEAAVRTLGLHLPLVKASNAIEIEDAFSALVRDGVEALQIGVDPLFGNHTDQLVALATRQRCRPFTRGANLRRRAGS
jgi:hypothetical protein